MAYAFGSSTPREFSFLEGVPQRFRVYDVRIRSPQHHNEPTLTLVHSNPNSTPTFLATS